MHARLALPSLVSLLACLAGAVPPPDAEPVPVATGRLPNPGFEDGDRLPEGWAAWKGSDCVLHVWDKCTFRSGTRALYLRSDDREGSAAWRGSCDVKPDTPYRLTGWVLERRQRGAQGGALFRARGKIRSDGGVKVWETNGNDLLETQDGWKRIAMTFRTPPELNRIELWIWVLKGPGIEVWFDDLELEELPAAPTVP